MSARDSVDPWQMPQPAGTAPDPVLLCSVIADIIPLDRQMGVQPRKTVPDALQGAIFGQPAPTRGEPGQPMHSYAILDAAKLLDLSEPLSRSGLAHLCLFKGEAQEQMGDAAPWIVRLQEGNSFTRNLFTRSKAPWHLWDAQAGIFLRSRCRIEELQAHLRRFTRLQDETGAWYYFRFWEPAVAAAYFPTLVGRPGLARRWFQPRQGAPIATLIAIHPAGERGQATLVQPGNLDGISEPTGSQLLTQDDIRLFAANRRQADADSMADALRQTFGDEIAMPDPQLRDFARKALARLAGYGFRQRDHLFVMLSWELFFGPGFETLDKQGHLTRILHSPRDEAERFEMLRQRMLALG